MLKTTTLAALISLTAISGAAAQTKELPGEMTTLTATVEATDSGSRTLTLKKADGTYRTVVVPAAFQRFDGIKVGDTVTARFHDNIVFRKLAPGEAEVNSGSAGLTRPEGTRPNATVAAQRTITTTVTAIDESIPSLTLTGPNKWVYSSKVQDKSALKQLKVGDKVNVTWTEAVSIAVVPPK